MGDFIAEIQEIVSECLDDHKVVGITDSLLHNGVDSMNMLYILNEIEIRLDVKIPDNELVISNFETISQINDLVCYLKGKNMKIEPVHHDAESL